MHYVLYIGNQPETACLEIIALKVYIYIIGLIIEKQHPKLFIYLNVLIPRNLSEYAVNWTAYPYIQICNNTEK